MIAFFTRHPTAANLLLLVFLALGILSLPGLRRETFPDFRPREVEVRVVYRGATAEEVEEAICQRVEDALDRVRFVHELRSDARDGLAIFTVEMEPHGDYQAFKDEIDTEVRAIDDFPAEVEAPIVTRLHTTELVLAILVSGDLPATDLEAYCDHFKQRLQRQPEVALVHIRGFATRQLRVELAEEALRRFQLSAAEVAALVQRQSVDLPAGLLQARDGEITLRFVEQRRSAHELEDLVLVAGQGGAEIRLGDLGRVVELFEPEEEQVWQGNRRAGLLRVEMTGNQDVIRVANAVKQFLEEERQRYPQLDFTITQDHSILVQDRLQLLVKNGWQGMLLVLFTLWLFFHFRLAFWVVMTLPVSFLGAFFVMAQLDLTINMMTMVGMLLALGILMDDGIVIAENIATHRARGRPPMQAVITGLSEVQAGVFSSFITTACVLGPLIFLEGNIGQVLRVVPLVLLVVLVVSLVEAFCILPAHLAHAIHRPVAEEASGLRRHFDRFLDGLREQVAGRAVDRLLRWRYLWLGTVVCCFLLAIGLVAGGRVGFQAFPEMDGDVIEARLVLAPGTPLVRTQEVVTRITAGLARVDQRWTPRQPGGRPLVETVYVQLNQNPDAFEQGPHIATVTVDLLTAERRRARLDELLHDWRGEVGSLPDVLSLAFTEPGFGPQGRALEIRLQGDDLQDLQAAAAHMQAWLEEFDGVLDLASDLRRGRPELNIRLRPGALGLGLDAENLARQLRSAFQGLTADEIQVGRLAYEIEVRLQKEDRNRIDHLEQFQLTLPGGQRVPLGAVARIESRRGWSRIARVNGLRTVTLRGDVDSQRTHTMALVNQLRREFLPELQQQFPDIRVAFEGEPKEGATTRISILRGMLIGLLGVFLLLSFQFRSYSEPLIVMVAIPLALIGVVFAHLILGIPLSMPSLLGFVSLAGIVVNDSILLVLFIKREREQGRDVLTAASQSSRQRFRAILLTSLTTIAGLLPLLSERSLQAQVLIPLATSIAGGLAASTILVLFVIPCLYAVLDDFGWTAPAEQEPELLS